jgi:sporadic carbohydrate cluster protein (TIGR04323 family)
MSVAIIAGHIKFGPWVVPIRAQNTVSSKYAETHGMIVDTLIPEPVFSNLFDNTLWMRKHWDIKTIILYSMLQLPSCDKDIRRFIDQMEDMEIHFAMEDFSGKGRKFLEKTFKEASIFLSADMIEANSVKSYEDLHKQLLS